MDNYFEAFVQGVIRGVTSFFVRKKLEENEKTIQCPGKRKDGSAKK